MRTLIEMIAKQPTGTGRMQTHCLQTYTNAYNSFTSPALHGLSPFQLTYGRYPKVLQEIETNLQEGTPGSFRVYYALLRKRFAYFQKIVHNYRLQRLDMLDKDQPITHYKPRYLLYLISS